MRVVSWNVNGIRACVRRGFVDFLDRSGADILGVQEVRALPEEIPPAARTPTDWHAAFAVAERRGYSGVGIYSKFQPVLVETSLGEPRFDIEGRFIAAHFRTARGRFVVVNGYFPKGSGKDRDKQPGRLQTRLLLGCVRPGAATAAPMSSARDRGFQHRAPRDRPRSPEIQCQEQRVPPRGAGRARPLARSGLGGHLSRPASRPAGPLHLVAAVGRRARAERRVAHRLRSRVAERDGTIEGCLHLAQRAGLRPLPGRCRHRPLGRQYGEAHRVQKHKRTQDPHAGTFRIRGCAP